MKKLYNITLAILILFIFARCEIQYGKTEIKKNWIPLSNQERVAPKTDGLLFQVRSLTE